MDTKKKHIIFTTQHGALTLTLKTTLTQKEGKREGKKGFPCSLFVSLLPSLDNDNVCKETCITKSLNDLLRDV